MMSSLSPLAVLNRASLLLARSGWRMLAIIVIFTIIPTEALQYTLMAGHPRTQTGTVMQLTAGWLGGFVINSFGYLIAKLAALDDLDGLRRPFPRLVLAGAGLYVRACWLLIPVTQPSTG